MVKAKPQIALVYLIRIYISIHDINRIVMIDLENTCNTVGVVLLRSFSNNVIVKLMWFATRSFLIVMSIIDHKVSPQPQKKTTQQQPQHPPCGKTTLRWGGRVQMDGSVFCLRHFINPWDVSCCAFPRHVAAVLLRPFPRVPFENVTLKFRFWWERPL